MGGARVGHQLVSEKKVFLGVFDIQRLLVNHLSQPGTSLFHPFEEEDEAQGAMLH